MPLDQALDEIRKAIEELDGFNGRGHRVDIPDGAGQAITRCQSENGDPNAIVDWIVSVLRKHGALA